METRAESIRKYLEGLRKFISFLFVEVLTFVLAQQGIVTGEQWVDVQPWILGIFFGGNVGTHLVKTKFGNGNGEAK